MTVPQTSTREPSAAEPRERTAVRLRGVSRHFGGRRALGPVDLELEPGAVCLVEGANGAGKTTLLRVAAGLLPPTSGAIEASAPALYVAAGGGARPEQTVAQALTWVASVRPGAGMPVQAALELAGLGARADVRVGALSSGQRSRLSLALALVAGPALACLDEPTAHLDGAGVGHAAAAVEALTGAGCAVLVAAPQPGDLLALADARVCLDDGVAAVVP